MDISRFRVAPRASRSFTYLWCGLHVAGSGGSRELPSRGGRFGHNGGDIVVGDTNHPLMIVSVREIDPKRNEIIGFT